jgi:uncharacterized protein (TIGR02145 family)
LSPNAGLSNSYVPSEVVSDSIKLNLPGLQSNTVYYVRLCVLLRLTSSTNYYAVLGNESTFKTKIIPPIPTLPTVKTGSVSSVSNATAEIYGEVLSDGNSSIIKRGICIGINDSPTISGTMFLSEAGVGKFNIKLEKLNPATTYYARAFATNSAGTAYGLQVRFKTYTGTVEDITGQIYTTMQFGTQLWMRENLRTSKLNDGTAIPLVIDYNTWYTLPTPGYCWYGNKEDTIFGALYNWNAVNTNKLCPSGWHVPTYNEWKILINLFGGIQNSTTNFNLRDTMVGFLALFGGFRSYTEYDYADKNVQGYWWASTDENCYFLDANGVQIGQAYQELYSFQKRLGLSVRCIKDN